MYLSPKLEHANMVRSVLDPMGVRLQEFRNADEALRQFQRHRFEAVIVDCAEASVSAQLVRHLRELPAGRYMTVIAFVDGHGVTPRILAEGATFVISRGCSSMLAARCLRVAARLMLGERRRYFRYPVQMPVMLSFPTGQELRCTSMDLSKGGLAVRAPVKIEPGQKVQVTFTFPGTKHIFEATGEVVWSDFSFMAGLRFAKVEDVHRNQLEEWLANRKEEMEPEAAPAMAEA